jgi:hypothetical protein
MAEVAQYHSTMSNIMIYFLKRKIEYFQKIYTIIIWTQTIYFLFIYLIITFLVNLNNSIKQKMSH